MKGCPCDCEDYVNVQPPSKSGETIYNVMAQFSCNRDSESQITVSFDYTGASEENAFSIQASTANKDDIIYTFASTGQSSGHITATVTGSDIVALANGYYSITIIDNSGTSFQVISNTLDGIYKGSCNT